MAETYKKVCGAFINLRYSWLSIQVELKFELFWAYKNLWPICELIKILLNNRIHRDKTIAQKLEDDSPKGKGKAKAKVNKIDKIDNGPLKLEGPSSTKRKRKARTKVEESDNGDDYDLDANEDNEDNDNGDDADKDGDDKDNKNKEEQVEKTNRKMNVDVLGVQSEGDETDNQSQTKNVSIIPKYLLTLT